jgi:large subunit ribosomal protein L30e
MSKKRRRTSAKSQWNPDKEMSVAVKTGKCRIGFKETIRELAMGEIKLIILARNVPNKVKNRVMLLNNCLEQPVPVFNSSNSSWDLGAVLGMPFWVSCLAILDEGDSSIMTTIEKMKEQEDQKESMASPVTEAI